MWLTPRPAEAAVAKISGVVLQVTHRAGAAGQWRKSTVGAQLPAGSRVRTGKRSACEIKFPDGSRVRMGPRSDLVINDPSSRRVQVVAGQVFANIVRGTGGAQIQGATATCAVKGTSVLFTGPTMAGDYPARDYEMAAAWQGEADFSTAEGSETLGDGQQSTARAGRRPSSAGWAPPWAYANGTLYPWWWQLQPEVGVAATPGSPVGAGFKEAQVTTRSVGSTFLGGPPTTGDVDVVVQSLGAAPALGAVSLSQVGGWSAAAVSALSALAQSDSRELLGKHFFVSPGELDLAGILYNGGGVASAWGRGSAAWGNLYGEIGLQVLTSFEGSADGRVSDAFLVHRSGGTDVVVGRQRYIEGPVNNSALGSLFESLHFDGAAVKHTWPRARATVAWINDYDSGLPDPGRTGGWLGRLSTPVLGGTVGVNALNWRHEGWGWSADLSLPIYPSYLDAYGEWGQDPMGRTLSTYGVYFPRLYQSAGVDLFVECARREGYLRQVSALAYIEGKGDWSAVVGARKFEHNNWEYAVGGVVRLGTLAF